MTIKNHGIGRWQGAGLMATTLLGTSIFILPQMTINIAQQGALIAWLLLTIAIIPVTLVFARLSALHPHAAGPAYFAEQAFGRLTGRVIGVIFLFVVPIGAPAAILMTFQFVNALVNLTPLAQLLMELGTLLLLFLLNYRGIHVSAKLQFLLTLMIVIVVLLLLGAATLTLSVPVPKTTFVEFDLIMLAAGLAFWSFLGVEAMTHLADDFKHPKRDMIPAMMIGTLLVGALYLACTWLLLEVPNNKPLAMAAAFNQLLGGYGTIIIGALGIAGGLATVNVYTASVARLLCSFSQDGIMPRYFSQKNQFQVPTRALASILLLMACVLIFTYVAKQNIEDLIAWVNGVFVVIYLVSMLSAWRLLPSNSRPLIFLGILLCLGLVYGLAAHMLYAVILITSVTPLLYWQLQYQMGKQIEIASLKEATMSEPNI
ncbi:L-methionine/branched-chain amino acid transporter [Pseudoalteromonas tunicata]|uniref:L-methionine/branched-chain amino acid transporter n=1 Tax=Pseudoalteromonas tunicata TaxID=314281 RepID=UPI00273FFA84|nr:L-methionine/branched-chain amino acid transporter [Pseudoalteromonas tunicata]MDP4984623.1 L-methionine/branched-chain amino acid transporter [Pseudoalteromonas tunicata]